MNSGSGTLFMPLHNYIQRQKRFREKVATLWIASEASVTAVVEQGDSTASNILRKMLEHQSGLCWNVLSFL